MQELFKTGQTVIWNGVTYSIGDITITDPTKVLANLGDCYYCFVANETKINGVVCVDSQQIKTLLEA